MQQTLFNRKVILTWSDKRFFGDGELFLSESWRMVGKDRVSIAIPAQHKRVTELFNMLNKTDMRKECGDSWMLTGTFIETPEEAREQGCSANLLLLVDIDKTIETLGGVSGEVLSA